MDAEDSSNQVQSGDRIDFHAHEIHEAPWRRLMVQDTDVFCKVLQDKWVNFETYFRPTPCPLVITVAVGLILCKY
jgi:hypothetical protein